jgi:hypothetical protein
MVMNGQLFPHFSIEYRKHFTGFHATVVETMGGLQIGATECCVIMYSLQLMFAMFSDTNASATMVIDTQKHMGLPFSFSFTFGDFLAFCTFVLSLQYNVSNFWLGLKNANNKKYAALCILPYIYCSLAMVAASSYS